MESKSNNDEQIDEIEKLHRMRDPFLMGHRIQKSMPTLITLSIMFIFVYIFIISFAQLSPGDALSQISAFLNNLPKEAWTLLNIIFAFWFAGKAGSEIIQSYKDKK